MMWLEQSVGRVVVLVVALLCGAGTAAAAEIPVAAGDGTLQAAINSATAGDVLLLADGVYTNSSADIGITKSLTIRAASKAATPVIMQETRVQGSPVVIQGLEFNGMPLRAADSAASGGTLLVLESRFVEAGILGGSGTLSELYVIGNLFTGSVNLGIGDNATDLMYFAGNEVTTPAGVSINWSIAGATGPDCYFIGNRLAGTLQDESSILGVTPACRIIANRFEIRLDISYNTDVDVLPALSLTDTSYVSNNLFKLTDVSGLGAGSVVSGLVMARAGSGADSSRIENNVFDFSGLALSPNAATRNGVIDTAAGIVVQGNILVNSDRPWFTEDATAAGLTTFRNNLCFNNANDTCPAGDGNLNADPLFVDTVDYMPGGASPAINAGPDLAFLVDLDGTRSDMGLYGGPFPIDQYDTQRNDTTSAPFIYPLFDAGRNVTVVGDLPISVIGIARIR